METRMKTGDRFAHPQCPVLNESEMLLGLRNCKTVTEIDILDSFSSINTDDVCALSYGAPTQLQNNKGDSPEVSNVYWCNFCTFSTLSKTSLVDHAATHCFRCQNCQFNSYSRAMVVKHVLLEHHQAISRFRNFRYCTLVYSKAVETKRDGWHKPSSQEIKEGCTDIDDGNNSGLGNVSDIANSTEDDKIYIHFKKAYFSRLADYESVSGTNKQAKINQTSMQLPISKSKHISLQTFEQTNKESRDTFCNLKNDLTMSQTQNIFPTINTLLTLVSDSKNKPSSECWQSIQNNENISFATAKGIKMACVPPQDVRTNIAPENGFQSKQIYPALSTSTVVNDLSPEKAPEWQYETAVSQNTTHSTLSDNGRVKYIYGDPYDENTNEHSCRSEHSSNLMSGNEKIDMCTTNTNNNDFIENNGVSSRVVLPIISNNCRYILDRLIKTEPTDSEAQSFCSENRDDITSLTDAVQYPINENIQVKNEIPDVDEDELQKSSAFVADSTDSFCNTEQVCNEKYEDAKCHDAPGDKDRLVTNQGIDSSSNEISSVLWDCGQCEFQSNDYETCRRHIRTVHFTEGNNLLCCENRIRPATIKVPQGSSVIRELLEEGNSPKIFSCRTCNYGNPSSAVVKSHNIEQHLPTLLMMYRSNAMVFYCPEQCEYLSDSKADYLSHVKRCRGSFIKHQNSKMGNRIQASLMLTLRHIFSHDKSGMKRMFMCASCDFETDVLSDVTTHSTHHADNKHVAFKRDPCSTKVSWICLKCQIPVKLMQLKKHQCIKVGVLGCSDLACNQCHFGKKKSIFVCDQCNYETGCLLMIKSHQSNVCKSVYKEINPVSVSEKEETQCYVCNSDCGDGASHVCTNDVKVAYGTQSKHNIRRVTRSASKANSVSNFESIDRNENGSFGECGLVTNEERHVSKSITQSIDHKEKRSKKRKRTRSPKQIHITPLHASAEKTENPVNTGEIATERSIMTGGTPLNYRSNDKSPTSRIRIWMSQDEEYKECLGDMNNQIFSQRSGHGSLTPKDYKHQTRDNKVGHRPATAVLPDLGIVSHSSASGKSNMTKDRETLSGREVTESEFKPLSMLEWLNTESRRMLKLLKP